MLAAMPVAFADTTRSAGPAGQPGVNRVAACVGIAARPPEFRASGSVRECFFRAWFFGVAGCSWFRSPPGVGGFGCRQAGSSSTAGHGRPVMVKVRQPAAADSMSGTAAGSKLQAAAAASGAGSAAEPLMWTAAAASSRGFRARRVRLSSRQAPIRLRNFRSMTWACPTPR